MHVIEVMPLARGTKLQSLTYYSSESYPVGTLIDIPLRKQTKRGVVVSTKPVSLTKAALRSATFTLRKLPQQPNQSTLPPPIIETAKRLSKTTPATVSAILFALLPPEVRSGEVHLESSLPCIGTYETPQVSILQGTREERLLSYRSKVREAFAHRGSVLLVVPTSQAVSQLVEELENGIENRIVTFSAALSKKKLRDAYTAFHDLSQAKLVITTPSYALLDRHDITTIIIENARSSYYKAKVRPYIDTREALITLARVTSRHVMCGDLLARSEEEFKRREDFYLTEGEAAKRLTLPARLSVVEQPIRPSAGETFALLSPQLIQAIEAMAEAKGRAFLYAARRGLAPLVTCVDCGHIFRCPDSGAPYSLLETKKGEEVDRWFLAASGQKVRAADTCPTCGSWRLKERGVGIQFIEQELRAHLPDIPIVTFDHQSVTTHRQALQKMAEFYDQKGVILLGTAMAIPYIEKPVMLSAVTSLEAVRATPTWRAEEELLALLLTLRERTTDTLLIQTRTPDDEVVEHAKKGTVESFYNEELDLREQLHYPPFATFIHFTLSGNENDVAALEEQITKSLLEETITFYHGAPYAAKKLTFGLLRVPKNKWPNPKLMDQLRSLPPQIRIEVNPERIV